jgi:hypothetical protein
MLQGRMDVVKSVMMCLGAALTRNELRLTAATHMELTVSCGAFTHTWYVVHSMRFVPSTLVEFMCILL